MVSPCPEHRVCPGAGPWPLEAVPPFLHAGRLGRAAVPVLLAGPRRCAQRLQRSVFRCAGSFLLSLFGHFLHAFSTISVMSYPLFFLMLYVWFLTTVFSFLL